MLRIDLTLSGRCLVQPAPRKNGGFPLITATVAACIVALALMQGVAVCQTLPNITVGDQLGELPYETYHGGDIDAVSLTNGMLSLHASLLSYPQRGNLSASFSLRYNNIIQHYGPLCVAPDPCELDWTSPYASEPVSEKSDVFASFDQGLGLWFSAPYPTTWKVGSTTYTENFGDYYITTPDGGKHILGNLGTASEVTYPTGGPTSYLVSSGPFETLDATGIKLTGALAPISTLSGSSLSIRTSEGNIYNYGLSSGLASIEDPNGNYLTLSGGTITDTLGRSITNPPTAKSSSNTSTSVCPTGPLSVVKAVAWNPPAANGATATYTFCYVTVTPNMPDPIVIRSGQTVTGGMAPTTNLQSIVLPNGLSWQFEYNDPDGTLTNNGQPVTYGTLSKITLPTGGSISYTWVNAGGSTAANNSNFCNTGGRWVASRTVIDLDGVAHKWKYAYNVQLGSYFGTVVTDPLGNDTAHAFGIGGGVLARGCTEYETQTLYYQGSHTSGTLLKTINTTYQSTANGNTFPNAVLNVVPITISTAYSNGQTTQTSKGYDSGFTYTDHFGTAGATGIYGKVVSEQAYDYGSNGPGPLLRTTKTSYAWQSPNPNYSSYLSNNLLNRAYSIQINDGGGTKRAYTYYGYDESGLQSSGVTEQKVAGESYPGNQTSVHRWLNGTATATASCNVSVSNGYVTSSNVYFDTGEVLQSVDSCSDATTYEYSSSYYGAFLTTTTNPLNQSRSYGYDFNTGVVTSLTDSNSQVTTKSYDILARPISVSYPDGGLTTYCYTDVGGPTCSKTGSPYGLVITKAITSTLNETSTILFDGLGRLSQTQLNSDPNGVDYSLTTYDALGRKSQVYNPTRCSSITTNCGESTWGYTVTNYDALGRIYSVAEQDNSNVSTNYGAFPCTVVTDEAGKSRQSCVDGLGRMTGVWEDPGASPHLNYETDYTYDALGNLTYVNQKGSSSASARTRSFVYDSLSRLTSAANPESGNIGYTYDANGNVITKTAPAPNQTGTATVTTSYFFDALNRMTNKSYSDGTTPHTIYQYDTSEGWGSPAFPQNNIVGGLSGSWIGGSSAASEIFSYDAMGRVLGNPQCTPSTCGNSSFNVFATYDLAGDLTSTTTAKGTVISYGYGGAERLTVVTGSLNDSQHPGTLYSTDATYGYYPNGAIRKAAFGTGLTETQAYNSRLQPCRINVNSGGTYFSTCTDSVPTGNLLDFTMGYNAGSSDNGNVATWSAVGKQTFSRSYGYDSLNRIQTISDSASGQACKGLSWTIDAWSNLTVQTTTAGTCLNFSAAVNANNQLVGFQYDAAGNMTYDGTHHYTYDAENRVIQVDSGSTASYVYDANGRRIRTNKWGGSSWTEYSYGPNGSVQGEYNGSSWPVEYVYAGNQLIAEYTNSTTEFIHPDHLGSTRLVTAVNQSISDNMDYLPFGQQIAGSSATTHKFTGKERDSESGLDNFGARYNASTMGRFMTPDPLPWPHWQNGSRTERRRFAEFLTNPQNFNMYSYVRNNPLNSVDPDGLDVYVVVYTTGNSEGDEQLKRAAQTKKDQITSSKGFDPKKDTVILAGVKTKEDFQNVLNSAAKIADQFGKTTNVSLFSHAGDISGPVFHDAAGHPTQFTQSEMSNLKVNWGANSTATFYGCRTANNFTQDFANAQNVRSFGFLGGVDFSGRPDSVSKWYLLNGQFDLFMVDKGEKGLQERDPE